MLEHKQFQNMAFTGSNSYWCLSKSIENQLDEQTVVFIVAVNHDKYRKESIAEFYDVFFARSLVSSRNSLVAMLL